MVFIDYSKIKYTMYKAKGNKTCLCCKLIIREKEEYAHFHNLLSPRYGACMKCFELAKEINMKFTLTTRWRNY